MKKNLEELRQSFQRVEARDAVAASGVALIVMGIACISPAVAVVAIGVLLLFVSIKWPWEGKDNGVH